MTTLPGSDVEHLESVILGWDTLERQSGRPPVIDYLMAPRAEMPRELPLPDLTSVQGELGQLQGSSDVRVGNLVAAHETYLNALMGNRLPISEYLQRTQGVRAEQPETEHCFEAREHVARVLLEWGIEWGPGVLDELSDLEGRLSLEDLESEIRRACEDYGHSLASDLGVSFEPNVRFETVDKPESYWSYWTDGTAERFRVRINRSRAVGTRVTARQFALHEVLGHVWQLDGWRRTSLGGGGFARYSSVHTDQQTLLEGLAQTLPMLVTPDDDQLMLRVELARYQQRVLARAHIAVNQSDARLDNEVEDLMEWMPWLTREEAMLALEQRRDDPLLRSYLWSYYSGVEAFTQLFSSSAPEVARRITGEAYKRPIGAPELLRMISEATTAAVSDEDPGTAS